MQTRDNIIAKLSELEEPRRGETLHDKIVKEAHRLLASGALDLESADNDFRIPRLVYVQALRNIADGYTPMSYDKGSIKMLKNLARF